MREENREERGRERPKIGEGLRTGIGMLYALKDAIEETVTEAVQRGDLGADRARQAAQEAWQRAQERFDEAREDFDLVPRKEFDRLRTEVQGLRERLDRLERSGGSGGTEDPGGIIIEPE